MSFESYPQNIEAERALLGGFLQDPGQLLSVDIEPEHLHRDDHRALLRHLRSLRSDGVAVDMATLPQHLIARGVAMAEMAYIVELPDHCPSTANLTHYADAVKLAWRSRELRMAAERAIEAANAMDSEAAATAMRSGLGKAAGGGIRLSTLADLAGMTVTDVQDRFDKAEQGIDTGIMTGLRCMDDRGGLERGDLVILAARPSVGKTAMALSLLTHAIGSPDEPQRYTPFVYSGEMALPHLGHRMLSDKANVGLGRIRRGYVDHNEWRRIIEQTEHWRTRTGFASDAGGLTPTQVVGLMHRSASIAPIDIALIDYLTLLNIRPERGQTKAEAVGQATKDFKQAARDLDIAVVLLAQLNRGGADSPPKVHHLKESGDIEQDADVICLMSKPHAWAPLDYPEDHVIFDMAKWRNAWTGTADMRFVGSHQRFIELESGP